MLKLPLLLYAVITSTILLAQSATGVPFIVNLGFNADKWQVTSPANVQYIDGKYAVSKTLKLTQANIVFRDFRFSIPSTATIQGIDVRITRKKKGANTVKDVTVAILRPINETEAMGKGPNLAKPDPWTETITTALYPFPSMATDADNLVFQWTPADVNHAAFALFFGISVGSGRGANLLIDRIELTVKYTQGTTSYSQTSSITNSSSIELRQLHEKYKVSVKEEGRYVFTVRTTTGVIVQQTIINSGREVMVPIDSRFKGFYIITVEGNNQVKSQLAFLQ